ncbi:MAG: hypothetical protein JW738_02260, partial [Actinobacteria bacterium]|nr:hypothetical protein [Actinomycetota bacterium]
TMSYFFYVSRKAGMSAGGAVPGLLDSEIRVQKMLANGEYSPGWGPDGLATSTSQAFQIEPVMTTDGEGGVIVSWSQADQSLNELNIMAQRMVTTTSTWYLAEGSQSWGFDAYVTIENPNTEAATARVTFMTPDGPTTPQNIALPPESQTTISPKNIIGYETDFSTKVQCLEGLSIAVDRTMFWTGINAPSPEAHSSIGVNSPETTWYLPEGSSAWGFECWLLIQNPNSTEATCTLTYMIEGQNPQQFEKKIPADSRQSMNMAEYIGANDASIMVTSDLPVVAERSMYRNQRRAGHESIGTTETSTDYYLAEGSTAWGFDTYLLVQNPNQNPAIVTINYMTAGGPVTMEPMSMPPYSRKTINVSDALPNTDFSTQVHADQPIIAERAMYWGGNTPVGQAMHDSIGMPEPHRIFYLPDGQSSDGRETFTLVQNLNNVPVDVRISYLTPDGTGNQVFTETIPALSRVTYSLADKIPGGRAAIVVESLTSGKKIMAERAMYWNNRGVGTSTIGGFSN